MLQRANAISDGAQVIADLVIVGAGAAGISMAIALKDSGLDIVLMESGGDSYDDAMQDLYKGRIVGTQTEPLDVSRLRYFGGTTNHWTGWCRPLEAVDFEGPQPWPFKRTHLDPFYHRAAALCELGPDRFDAFDFWNAQPGGEALKPLATSPDKLTTAVFQISPPTHFGERYGDALQAAENITVLVDATVLSLTPAAGSDPNQDRKRIAGVSARTRDGRRFSVQGRAVVIATGGLETPRLLLQSTEVFPAGTGNERDLVGRYFQDHPWIGRSGFLSFSRPNTALPLYFEETALAGATIFGTLASTPGASSSNDIGGFRIWLTPSNRSQLGLDSARQLADAVSAGTLPNHLWDHVSNIFSDLDILADRGYRAAFGTQDSPFLAAPNPNDPVVGAWVDLNFEQNPNPDSRVTLDPSADAIDAFGQRRIVLDWRLDDRDRRTASRAMELLGEEVGRLGLGRLQSLEGMTDLANRWPARLTGSRHHMGTARMADDPRQGVTDASGRVHSTENLYICGSALFPSSGYANPTLTIVALALRQADHLAERLTKQAG